MFGDFLNQRKYSQKSPTQRAFVSLGVLASVLKENDVMFPRMCCCHTIGSSWCTLMDFLESSEQVFKVHSVSFLMFKRHVNMPEYKIAKSAKPPSPKMTIINSSYLIHHSWFTILDSICEITITYPPRFNFSTCLKLPKEHIMNILSIPCLQMVKSEIS